MSSLELTSAQIANVLYAGEIELLGQMRYSSNGTFLVEACADGVAVPAVYKPRRGERPLWDFPDGTLCQREVAAFEVSNTLGWGIVPVTILRTEGPLGIGALQRFVEHDPEEHYFTLLADNQDRFRQFAAYDIVVNNTDRKGGHCLHDLDNGLVVGIDHGLTFSVEWKLRTVVWDFAGEDLSKELIIDLERLVSELDGGLLAKTLTPLLSPVEIAALNQRTQMLLRAGKFPHPDEGYHSVPWPLV